MSGSSVFDTPAKKIFLLDLCFCKEIPGLSAEGSPSTSHSKSWQANCGGIQVTLSVITIQGTVTQVNSTDDSLYLDDGTAVALVKGYSKVPFCSIKPAKVPQWAQNSLHKIRMCSILNLGCKLGQYLMVVGQVQKSGRIPVIRAIKLQNLTDNIAMTVIWPLEVIDELGQNGNVT